MIKFVAYLFLILIFFLKPVQLLAAEVLQVRTSSLLQIGDQNRTYTVKLACIEVDALDEVKAREWLKIQLPRRKKVNLRPTGSLEGILLAKVNPIGKDLDLGQGLIDKNLATYSC